MSEIYDDDTEQNEDCILTKRDFEDLAKQYIRLFFRDKIDEYGSVIDPEDLYTKRNISLVLNLTICDGMPIIYNALKSCYKKDVQKRKGKISEDIQLVLKVLNDCAKVVPKNSAVGLLAIYIEVCKGCKLDY